MASDRTASYWGSAEYHTELEAFVARCAAPEGYVPAPDRGEAAEVVEALQASAIAQAARGADVLDVCALAPEDPRNVWALNGRLAALARIVTLPLMRVPTTFSVPQRRWGDSNSLNADDFTSGGLVDGHSTGMAVWDAGVVLADLLTHAPAVLMSLHPTLARTTAARSWSWEGKRVVELGCGAAALPSLATAMQGAGPVHCTDGDGAVMPWLNAHVEKLKETHPRAAANMRPAVLRWGEGGEAEVLGGVEGVKADVVLAADVLYVLENPGAWGALLRTILALSDANTLVFLTYTERGARKTFARYLERLSRDFAVAEVSAHLLHPLAARGVSGRLETHVGPIRVFGLARVPPS